MSATTTHDSINEFDPRLEQHVHARPKSFWSRYLISYDHKVIAKQFLIFGVFWTFVGIIMSLMIRWAQSFPGQAFPIIGNLLYPASDGVIPPDAYTTLFTMHGTIMIFFSITPILIGCFGNFLIPLMIGARDMLFPWLNMASFWLTFVGGLVMFASFFVPMGPSAVGWTSYPPLASAPWTPGLGHTLWLISLYIIGTASILGAINYVATVIRLRAPGMGYFDMPLSIWGLWLTAILNALFLPVLASGLLLLLLDRVFGTQFFLAGAIAQQGTMGDPILYQHLFWIFGHPEVYIIILPAWGMISDLLSFFSRKPAFNARWTAISMSAVAVLSTVVYGHHMFTTNMAPLLTSAFTTLTMMISIPSGIFFLNWLGTMWRGQIQLTTAMWFSIGAVFTFGLGGLTGLHLAAVSTNLMLHNTYFVVGHFHLTMASAALLGTLAATYFWFPKLFGKMMSERIGKIHFWMTFIPLVFIFVALMVLGYKGMPRRYYNPYEYDFMKSLLGASRYIWIAAVIAFLGLCLGVFNMIYSYFFGKKASNNPWNVGTLEWTISSPPPVHNFDKIPTVVNGPHEFSNPLVTDKDWISQTEYIEGVSKKVGAVPESN